MADLKLTDADKALLAEVSANWESAERDHRPWRQRWNRFHSLYHNFTDWRDTIQRDRVDRDIGLPEMQRDWGAQLFIPLTFTLIESILPELVAADPDLTMRPPAQGREGDVAAIKALIEQQSDQMDFQLKLHTVGKSGLMYGLGVLKTYWRKEYATRRGLQPSPYPGMLLENGERMPDYSPSAPKSVCVYDDPDCDAVDIWDFRWDPFGYDADTLGWVFHRTWRSTKYVMDMLTAKTWTTNGFTLSQEDVEGMGSRQAYDDTWQDRLRVQGRPTNQADSARGQIHEVWEFHDGDRVVTVLDRKAIVQSGKNPHWHGEMPFQFYRPVENLHQLVGKGSIEPGEDLQEEMNTLRSMRLDNGAFVLQRSFAYQDGLVDPADLKVGPGMAFPTTGPPSEALYQLPMQDVPNSSFQEVAALTSDYERTTGLNDAQVLAAGNTATEAQYVQQQVSARVRLQTKRLSREVVRPAACQILYMDQQRIRDERTIAIPSPPEPGGEDHRFAWIQIGPEQLQGEWKVTPDDKSMVPVNIAQDRQDGQVLAAIFAQPNLAPVVDPRRLTEIIARKFGIEPDQLLAPAEPRVPPVLLDLLVEAGVPQQLIEEGMQAAQEAEQTGQAPQWPPPDVLQAHDDVAQEDQQRQMDDAVRQAMPATAPAANGGSSK